jgi:hypothetical protein
MNCTNVGGTLVCPEPSPTMTPVQSVYAPFVNLVLICAFYVGVHSAVKALFQIAGRDDNGKQIDTRAVSNRRTKK